LGRVIVSKALTPALAVSSRSTIRRRRDLPIAGEVLVKEGDSVAGDQVVARAQLEGELRLVRVAEILGIPATDLATVLRVREGEQVEEGALLAELRGLWGLFRSTVLSPIAGTIEFISNATGHVGVRAPSMPLNLSAYMRGRVVSVEPLRSVLIEAESTFVQGIFGVGGERLGRISMLPLSAETVIAEAHIPERLEGQVLVGGHSPTYGALVKAAKAGAVGFITGSIDDRALTEYVGHDIGVALTGDENVSMTLIITEGFGSLPISERVLQTLGRINGEVVSLNGATQVRAGAQRPEVIGPMCEAVDAHELRERSLSIGARIRVIRVPYFGAMGVVMDLPHELSRIETGAEVRILVAKLDDGRQVAVPRANVELA
jgi:hypothetical protein